MDMDRNADTKTASPAIEPRRTILGLLGGGNKKARFMTELYAALRRRQIEKAQADTVVAELEASGEVMIRDHFCADPHLAGVDLRVIAPVESSAGADAQARAIRIIDEAWNTWLGEYLSNHRCG
jgi:hypothetical protein